METRRQKTVDTAAIIIIAAFILFGCFGRTVITGKEISKLPILASEDYFFNNTLRFTVYRPRFDPSLYQFHIPFQLYAQKEMSKFQLPLWNPCFGCGFPTLGELQYCTFSPFRGIFQAANPYLYNLGIAIKALIAALSMFALCRLFAFSTGASAFGAIAYSLSPFILRELELPNEVQMFPLTAAAFIYLGNSKNFFKPALLGVCTAIALASMHPEFFFLTILNSLLVMLVARRFSPGDAPAVLGKNILIAGLIGVGLSAPLLLPFAELVSNADSYKFHEFFVQKNFVQTLVVGLISPVNKGGSAFLGVLTIWAATFALICGKGKNLALAGLVFALGIWCCLPEPLEQIRLFTYIPPRYLHAPLLMSLALLAAHGVDLLAEVIQKRDRKALIFLAAISIILAITPFLVLSSHVVLKGYDGTLPVPELLKAEAIKGAISIAVAFVVMVTAFLLKLPKTAVALLPIFLLVINLFSLSDSSRVALSPTFAFNYRKTGAIEEIVRSDERMTAHSEFFFHPNISLSYGMRDFRVQGPLIPRWVAAINRLSWRRAGDEKGSRMANKGFYVSTIYDAASVKYIMSLWPIASLADKPLGYKPFACLDGAPHNLIDGAVLKKGEYCLSTNGEIFCKFDWELEPQKTVSLAAEIDILDQDGKVLARGSRSQLTKVGGTKSNHCISILIPDFKKRHGPVYLVLNLYSGILESVLPLKTTLPMRANGVELLKITPEQTDLADLRQARLRFVKEDNEHILLYENTTALPQAYLTTSITGADSLDVAIEKVGKPEFDARSETVIEAPSSVLQLPNRGLDIVPATVERLNSQSVSIKSNSNHDGFLIFTDTFYGGWHAFLDGKEVPIYRANVSFRAIKVPSGQHQIRFDYRPYNFYIGIAIATTTLLLAAFIAGLKLRNGN